MAVINNHSSINLDTTFQSNHTELFQFFYKEGLDVEINHDFSGLRTLLLSKEKDDYAYDFDPAFETELNNATGFVLYLKLSGEVVATYAAKKLMYSTFIEGMKAKFDGTYENIDLGNSLEEAYSSCQWVSKNHRGKRWGRALDHLKKDIVFDILKCDLNYAIHKEAYKDYHTEHLAYKSSEKLALIPNGDVGGAGEVIDKVYHITYITNTEWTAKQGEIKALYS